MSTPIYLSEDQVESQMAAKYNLLVHAGFDTLQFAIVDFVRDQVRLLAEYHLPAEANADDVAAAIRSATENTRQLRYSFNKILVSYTSFSYTLIPQDLFENEQIENYSRFISHGESVVTSAVIRSVGAVNINAVNTVLKNTLEQIFGNPAVFNQASPFIEGAKKLTGQDKEALFADLDGRSLQLAVFKNGQLNFYNLFEVLNPDEFNYYLLSVIEQAALDTANCKVYLSGKIDAGDENHNRITKYFDSVSFADPSAFAAFPDKLQDQPPHRHFSLLSLGLCG